MDPFKLRLSKKRGKNRGLVIGFGGRHRLSYMAIPDDTKKRCECILDSCSGQNV